MIRRLAPHSLIVLLVAAVYARTATHEFLLWDDDRYVTSNPFVREGMTWEGVRRAFSLDGYAANWHPVTWLSHMLDVELFGLRPGPHHLVSVALHALAALLLFLFLARATSRRGPALAVACLFAVHPLHVESVAWLAERKDVLAMVFGLASLIAYERHARAPSPRRLLLSAGLLALGLMAKPTLVTFPFLFLLLDFWPLGRWRRGALGRLLLEKTPFFALVILSSALTLVAQRRGGAVQSEDLLPFATRLANALTSYVAYLGKAVWPIELPFFYPYPDSIPAWKVTGAAVFLLAATAAAWRWRRAAPSLLVGWLWYLGALVPMIGLVQVGLQSMANRYAYLPMVGLYTGVVYALADRLPARTARVAAAAAVAYFAGIAFWQVGFWKDDRTLYERALSITDGSFVAHHYLGIVAEREGRTDDAIRHFEEAVRIFTERRRRDSPETRLHLGALLVEAGKAAEAVGHLRRAERMRPDDARIPYNLGIAYEALGRTSEAEAAYRRAVELDPGDWEAWNRFGALLAKAGRLEEARSCFERSVEANDRYAPAWSNLGLVARLRGDPATARRCFERALRADPGYERARRMLAELEGS